MMPCGCGGESPGDLSQVEAAAVAKNATCAVRAPGESVGHAEPPAIDRPPLRARVVAMRDELRARLADAEILEPSWLHLLADVETVLAALDREAL